MDEDGRTDAEGWSLRLRPNTQYSVTLRICCADANATAVINIAGIGDIPLTDPDGDHLYSGSFQTGPRSSDAVSMTLTVTCGDSAITVSSTLNLIDPEGVVYDAVSGQLLGNATVTALEGQTTGANSTDATFAQWNAADFGQVNPQSTAADGHFSFLTPAGLYRLEAGHSGYQPYRSTDINVVSDPVQYNVPLTPLISDPAKYTVQVSEEGFSPAVLTVELGAVIEWVNVGADSHSATSTSPTVVSPAAAANGWDSGLLGASEAFKTRLNVVGTYTYRDAQNPLSTATIIVQQGGSALNHSIFLPTVRK
jgi:plastocyanin